MRQAKQIEEWKKTYIRVNHADFTASELSKTLQISDCKVYSYCKELGIKTKPNPWYKQNRTPDTIVKGHSYVPRYKKAEKKRERPPAVYSNSRPYDY